MKDHGQYLLALVVLMGLVWILVAGLVKTFEGLALVAHRFCQ